MPEKETALRSNKTMFYFQCPFLLYTRRSRNGSLPYE